MHEKKHTHFFGGECVIAVTNCKRYSPHARTSSNNQLSYWTRLNDGNDNNDLPSGREMRPSRPKDVTSASKPSRAS